jgi:hypothetical protein
MSYDATVTPDGEVTVRPTPPGEENKVHVPNNVINITRRDPKEAQYWARRVRSAILGSVDRELRAQDEKWGEQNHPDYSPAIDPGFYMETYAQEAASWKRRNAERVSKDVVGWDGVLLEEVYEALESVDNPQALAEELIQVAAVAVQWVAAIRRRYPDPEPVASSAQAVYMHIDPIRPSRFESTGYQRAVA